MVSLAWWVVCNAWAQMWLDYACVRRPRGLRRIANPAVLASCAWSVIKGMRHVWAVQRWYELERQETARGRG